MALVSLAMLTAVGCSKEASDRGVQPASALISTYEDFVPYRKQIALVVGIDRYGGTVPELQYAVKDARAVSELLQKDLGFDQVRLLVDRQASHDKIFSTLWQLREDMRSEDQFLFFFAGHGAVLGAGDQSDGYLVPQDAAGMDGSSLSTTGISMDELARRLNLLPAKHVLMIVDTCFSGFAVPGLRGHSPATDQYLRSLTKFPARQILTAGNRNQQAHEDPAWGHSAFTHELLRGFHSRAADSNGDGLIIGSELHGFLSAAVFKLTGGRQSPKFFRLGRDEGEFAFVLPMPLEKSQSPLQDALPTNGRPEERLITSVKRDKFGELLAFCDAGSSWSPRSKEDIVDDIESERLRYYVDWAEGERTLIRVVTDRRGKYLKTAPDGTELNNLSSLPDCEEDS